MLTVGDTGHVPLPLSLIALLGSAGDNNAKQMWSVALRSLGQIGNVKHT